MSNSDEILLPPIHVGVLGDSGSGKSEFAATFPAPRLVLHCDPYGKDAAYLRRGVADPASYTGAEGQPIQLVHSAKTGQLVTQIEYYHDDEPEQPRAFDQLFNRFPSIVAEVREGLFKSVILETWTSLDLYARYRRSAGPLKSDKPNIYATDDLEKMGTRLNALRCNVVINCHIDKDKQMFDSGLKAVPMGPGRLRSGFAAGFASEMYHSYKITQDDGTSLYLLQTEGDAKFECCTRIGAPNPSYGDYRYIVGPWIESQRARANGAAQPTAEAERRS